MPNQISSLSANLLARICGVLYIYIIVGGMFMGLYVRPSLVVPGDAELTANKILAGEFFFRMGITAELLTIASDIAVAVILYLLFRQINHTVALLAAFMRFAADIILGMSSLLQFAALRFVKDSSFLDTFSTDQTQAFALLAMNLQNDGYTICLFFFGFALISLGYVIYRASYFPSIIGVLLIIAGVCYLVHNLAYFLKLEFAAALEPLIYVPMFIAEFSLAAWLLIKGVDAVHWEKG